MEGTTLYDQSRQTNAAIGLGKLSFGNVRWKKPIIWGLWPMVPVAADRAKQPIGGRGRRILRDRGAHQPGAAVHLEPANIGAAREHRPVGPEATEALAVLQAGG